MREHTNALKGIKNPEAIDGLNSEEAYTHTCSVTEAFWDPTPRPAPRAWYLHEEEGGEPLPELHLCLTAQVPAGWGTDLDTVRAGPAGQGNPTLLPCPGSQGRRPDLDSEGTQSRGARYHPSAWGPRSPLLLLVFLRLVYHCEAPAAEKEQVRLLDHPERPQSPAAWTRAGGRVQGLRQAQHIPASVSSSHGPLLPTSQRLGSLPLSPIPQKQASTARG